MPVRAATPDDIPCLVQMGEAFLTETGLSVFSFDPEAMAESFRGLLANPSAAVLIAEQDGRVVGAVGAAATTTLFNRRQILAQELFWYVQPNHRREAGTLLFLALRRWARGIGAQALSVAAMASSPAGVERCYRRAGFRPMENTWIAGL